MSREIFTLCRDGDEEGVRRMIATDRAVVHARDTNNNTPLHRAAHNGHTAIVQLLLQEGPDKDAKDIYDDTPLHCAACNGHTAIVQLLLNEGADKDAKNDGKKTPLHSAAQNGHTAIVQLLLDAGADKDTKDSYIKRTPLHDAARNGHTAAVKLLLQAGSDKDAKDRLNNTPLHRAAQNDHIAVVKLLLQAGADKDAKDDYDVTPLHDAARNGHTAIVQLLLQAGADIDSKTVVDARDPEFYNSIPLHWAAQNGHTAVVQLLLNAGADTGAEGEDCKTALDFARQHCHTDVVNLFGASQSQDLSPVVPTLSALSTVSAVQPEPSVDELLTPSADGKSFMHHIAGNVSDELRLLDMPIVKEVVPGSIVENSCRLLLNKKYTVMGPALGQAIREDRLLTSPKIGIIRVGEIIEFSDECDVVVNSGLICMVVTVARLIDGRGWVLKESPAGLSFLSELDDSSSSEHQDASIAVQDDECFESATVLSEPVTEGIDDANKM